METKLRNSQIIGIVCGAVMLLGFFFFPVLRLRGSAIWSFALENALDNAGVKNVTSITSFNIVYTVFGLPLESTRISMDDVARIFGYGGALECLFIFLLPVAGAIDMIVSSIIASGNRAVWMIIHGLLNLVMYIVQVFTLPAGLSEWYGFTVWQVVLIFLSIICVAMGAITSDSAGLAVPKITSPVHSSPICSNPGEKQGPGGVNPGHPDSPGDPKHPGSGGIVRAEGMLIGVGGALGNRKLPLRAGRKILIGRDPSRCDLVLEDPSISRAHCYVSYNPEKQAYCINDISTYGVYDGYGNQIRKYEDVFLKSGDSIRIGQTNEVFALK